MEQLNLKNQYNKLVKLLKAELNPQGFWSGKLSSSALGTAVAIVALKINGDYSDHNLIINGLEWLIINQNEDGGFGDTPQSKSNVSTSLLSYAAISYCKALNVDSEQSLANIEKYLLTQNIDLYKKDITSAVIGYYGSDYTFSVPILSMLIICGVLESDVSQKIPQ